jgi:hypothetical protein
MSEERCNHPQPITGWQILLHGLSCGRAPQADVPDSAESHARCPRCGDPVRGNRVGLCDGCEYTMNLRGGGR